MILKTLIALAFGAFLIGSTGGIGMDMITTESDESIAVIGGADGPTSLFIAGKADDTEDTLMLVPDENDSNMIATLPLKVTMKAVAYENGQLAVLIDNQSGREYRYGKEYFLQKKVDDNWQDMEAVEEYGWPKISLQLNDTENTTEIYDLTVFGELETGEYKLVKNDLEAEFTLTEIAE